MEDLAWRTLVREINADIAGIVQAQRILEAQKTLNEVHVELGRRAVRPLEEDFVFADTLGNLGAPHVVVVDGVEISIRMLHRRGLEQRETSKGRISCTK